MATANNKFNLIVGLVIAALFGVMISFAEGASALVIVLAFSAAALLIFRRFSDDKEFITRVFILALLVRIGVGILVHMLNLREFFGGDANTYDYIGTRMVDLWTGNAPLDDPEARQIMATSGAGWGMNYFVGAIYYMLGRNI